MIDLGWSAPERRLDAGEAREAILGQHVRIRGLLARAQAVAQAALDGQPPSPEAVASSIGDIRTTLEVHLAFEEKTLLPLLRDDLPLGPVRADRLLDEHRGSGRRWRRFTARRARTRSSPSSRPSSPFSSNGCSPTWGRRRSRS
jgi:hypothetical protein